MLQKNHSLRISGFQALPTSNGWKWHITFLYGGVVTSLEAYPTPDVALAVGRRWLETEATFNSLNQCLLEFSKTGSISRQEHRNLMSSFIKTTNHG
ncbi:MAG: hypothetical protein WA919_00555 [Coleofasciculaceae cyanobacterium]